MKLPGPFWAGGDPRKTAQRADAAGRRDKAAVAWRQLAEAGDLEACLQLGARYETGDGVVQDFAESIAWFRRAAEAGSVEAQSKLGEVYGHGRQTPEALKALDAPADVAGGGSLASLFPQGVNVTRDDVEAARWNLAAAKGGHVGAQVRFADQCLTGQGVPFDERLAAHWYGEAAKAGDPSGQYGLGMLCANPDSPLADIAAAVDWFEKAASARHPGALLSLGLLCWSGRGLPPDADRARTLLTAAAEAGAVEAMYRLGQILRLDRRGDADVSAAESWLARAAARGHLRAQVALGGLFLDPPHDDPVSAAIHLRAAAEQGDAEAQFVLGNLCLEGAGVALNPQEAARWFRAAAQQGYAPAFERLGALHATGLGVSDDPKAAAWLFRQSLGPAQAAAARADVRGAVEDPGVGRARDLALAVRGDVQACLRLGALAAAGGLGGAPDATVAANWYRRAADFGSPEGMVNLALLQLQGLVEEDIPGEAVQRLDEAAERGYRAAFWALYNLYAGGGDAEAQPEVAQKWLLSAARRGDAAAACLLASACEEGAPGAIPVAEAHALLETVAKAGDANAQALLGRWLWTGAIIPQDRDAGGAWLARAAKAEHPFAEAWMADVIAQDGGPAALATAREWYWRAARHGHLGALLRLAEAALERVTSPAESAEIVQRWEGLAGRGDPEAQYMAANLHLAGVGAGGVEAAGSLMRAAAAQGHGRSRMLLAALCLEGKLAQTHDGEAVTLLQDAARDGDSEAAYNLGVCLNRGIGVTANPAAARHWFATAAAAGNASALLVLGDEILKAGDLAAATAFYVEAARAGSDRARQLLKAMRVEF